MKRVTFKNIIRWCLKKPMIEVVEFKQSPLDDSSFPAMIQSLERDIEETNELLRESNQKSGEKKG